MDESKLGLRTLRGQQPKNTETWPALCADLRPEDGISPAEEKRHSLRDERRRRAARGSHRQQQYCHAVREALSLEAALTDMPEECSWLERLELLEILPESGGCALLCVVGLHAATAAELVEAETVLRDPRRAGRLRAMVASATPRQRTPHVKVRVVPVV
jgi:hypothetical protein